MYNKRARWIARIFRTSVPSECIPSGEKFLRKLRECERRTERFERPRVQNEPRSVSGSLRDLLNIIRDIIFLRLSLGCVVHHSFPPYDILPLYTNGSAKMCEQIGRFAQSDGTNVSSLESYNFICYSVCIILYIITLCVYKERFSSDKSFLIPKRAWRKHVNSYYKPVYRIPWWSIGWSVVFRQEGEGKC